MRLVRLPDRTTPMLVLREGRPHRHPDRRGRSGLPLLLRKPPPVHRALRRLRAPGNLSDAAQKRDQGRLVPPLCRVHGPGVRPLQHRGPRTVQFRRRARLPPLLRRPRQALRQVRPSPTTRQAREGRRAGSLQQLLQVRRDLRRLRALPRRRTQQQSRRSLPLRPLPSPACAPVRRLRPQQEGHRRHVADRSSLLSLLLQAPTQPRTLRPLRRQPRTGRPQRRRARNVRTLLRHRHRLHLPPMRRVSGYQHRRMLHTLSRRRPCPRAPRR